MYDPVGNRRVKSDSGALATSTYDAANQLTTLVDGSGVTTFTYDAAGNLRIQQAPAGGLTTYVWNDENQRTRVALPSGVLNTSTYNGDGLRSQKQDSSGVANFVWDGQNYLSEYDGSGVRTQLYLQTPDTYGLLLGRKRSTLLLPECYYHDATGSATALATSGSTTQNAKYLYKAFGETTLISGASTSPAFLWIGGLGYYFDADLLEYYLRARTYNPVLARFLSIDPLGFDAGDINFYRYVLNNALNLTDPSGLEKIIEACSDSDRRKCGIACKEDTKPGMFYDYLTACFWLKVNKGNVWCRTLLCVCHYRSCPGDVLFQLQMNVNAACGGLTPCDQNTSPIEAALRAQHFKACADARNILNNTCFEGGDADHRSKAAIAMGNYINCLFYSKQK